MKEIKLIISYKITDEANDIELSDHDSFYFRKFPTYEEVLEAFCGGTSIYAMPESRENVSFYFWATQENNEDHLDCDYEW